MNERELLEFAAKAAGWTGWQSKHGHWNIKSPDGAAHVCCSNWPQYDSSTGEKLPGPTLADAIAEAGWNPREDNGDAFRLAVRLRIEVEPWIHGDSACARAACREVLIDEPHYGDDPERATRRAIFRVAAELGKAMP